MTAARSSAAVPVERDAAPHLDYVTRKLLSAIYSDAVDAVTAWLDGNPIRIVNREALR